jgi:hypothetical protein
MMGFGARNAAIQLDDVAKLTIERTAAEKLNANIEVILRVEQIKTRNRTLRYVGCKLCGFEHPRHGPAGPCIDGFLLPDKRALTQVVEPTADESKRMGRVASEWLLHGRLPIRRKSA